MKRYLTILCFLGLAGIFAGCDDYLDVEPKGVILPEKVSDFEKMLNSYTLTQTFPSHLLYASDDVVGTFSKVESSTAANAYFWNPRLDVDSEDNPAVWGPAYRAIYNTNVIINKVMGAGGDSEEKKKAVLGEALVMRADLYFNALTFFAKAYNPSTATADPGLPWVTAIDVTESTPPRASVQAVLDSITTNLETAAGYLPTHNVSRARVNRYTAYGLLSRVYLYMHDYPNAQLYAEKALEAPHALNDYNEIFNTTFMLPMDAEDPEMLWLRQSEDVAVAFYLTYTQELLSLYEPDDLRLMLLAQEYAPGEVHYGRYDYGIFGIGIAELYLTKAEALARAGDVTGAMEVINLLRSKRIAEWAYMPLEAAGKEEALELVLHERRLELPFRGTRWMDMKRLDAEGRMPAVERVSAEGEVIETLPPNSPRYTFEIPGRVLLFNPGMAANHK